MSFHYLATLIARAVSTMKRALLKFTNRFPTRKNGFLSIMDVDNPSLITLYTSCQLRKSAHASQLADAEAQSVDGRRVLCGKR